MNIRLLTHSSHMYGFGHLSRSQVVAEQFLSQGYEVQMIELASLSDFSQALHDNFNRHTLFVIDLDPRFWEELHGIFRKYIQEKELTFGWSIFIFDDSQFVVRKLIAKSFENVVYLNPYQANVLAIEPDVLSGFDYFPFSKYLLDIRSRNLQYFSFTQIAITCGGSDPHSLTNAYLDLLNSFDEEKLKISILQGPLFSQNYIDRLNRAANFSNHKIDFVTQKEYSGVLFEKSGLVLTTGGLTRYELAFCGIPFITLNFDPAQEVTSRMFEANGASIHLGQNGQEPLNLRGHFHNTLRKLLGNKTFRIDMGRCGRNLFNESNLNLATRMINWCDNAR